jgi:peptidyl-prolyl cis-trans isomerase A (cyclophilin A)
MKTLLQSFPRRLKSVFNTINKIFIVTLLIPIVLVIGSCTQNQSNQGEKKQTKQIQNETKGGNPMVMMSTSLGDIKIELYQDKAPITVQNFLSYVNEEFFDGTIFHRVIPNFMIQGGGFTHDMQQKPTKGPIKNEADNGLKNDTGTIAMARTGVVDSATSQFFINQAANDFLNHGPRDFGYAVFGKVVEGMDVVNKIAGVQTGRVGSFQDVPVEPVVIISVRVVGSETK